MLNLDAAVARQPKMNMAAQRIFKLTGVYPL
jgi:hypothetical protein